MTRWNKSDFWWGSPEESFPAWLERHPEMRDANIERQVKVQAYIAWQNECGNAVYQIGGNAFRVAEHILIGGSTETPNWCWADWYGTHAEFQGDWSHIPDMPTPDWSISEDQVFAWVEHHTSILNKEQKRMDGIAEPIRCKVVFTQLLQDCNVPHASIKEFENKTGTLVMCNVPSYKGFYHAVLELDEPTPTFGTFLRNCWLAKTEAEVAEMNNTDTMWAEVYIVPEKPELVDQFAAFTEAVGFERLHDHKDYIGWKKVQPQYAAWLERQAK